MDMDAAAEGSVSGNVNNSSLDDATAPLHQGLASDANFASDPDPSVAALIPSAPPPGSTYVNGVGNGADGANVHPQTDADTAPQHQQYPSALSIMRRERDSPVQESRPSDPPQSPSQGAGKQKPLKREDLNCKPTYPVASASAPAGPSHNRPSDIAGEPRPSRNPLASPPSPNKRSTSKSRRSARSSHRILERPRSSSWASFDEYGGYSSGERSSGSATIAVKRKKKERKQAKERERKERVVESYHEAYLGVGVAAQLVPPPSGVSNTIDQSDAGAPSHPHEQQKQQQESQGQGQGHEQAAPSHVEYYQQSTHAPTNPSNPPPPQMMLPIPYQHHTQHSQESPTLYYYAPPSEIHPGGMVPISGGYFYPGVISHNPPQSPPVLHSSATSVKSSRSRRSSRSSPRSIPDANDSEEEVEHRPRPPIRRRPSTSESRRQNVQGPNDSANPPSNYKTVHLPRAGTYSGSYEAAYGEEEMEKMREFEYHGSDGPDVTTDDSLPKIKVPVRIRGGNKASSLRLLKRSSSIRFSTIEIRSYSRILGDNPSCSHGPAISIGWEYDSASVTVNVDEFEYYRTNDRLESADLVLSRDEREGILEEIGYSCQEIVGAVRRNVKVKNRRRQTVNNLPVARFEEMVEKATRLVKRSLFKKSTTTTKNSSLVYASRDVTATSAGAGIPLRSALLQRDSNGVRIPKAGKLTSLPGVPQSVDVCSTA